jgi:16S rRNA G966 N2-methylase RsmD
MISLSRSKLRELDLDIEQINLSWTERELPQRLRTKHVHGLHPYLGKFIPQLVEIFLRYYFKPGQRVLDPFVGSGTTLVEANILGIHSVGIDISEFNCLLSRVKTAKYDLMLLRKEIFNILERVKQTVSTQLSLQLPLMPSIREKTAEYIAASEYLERWYAPQARLELLTYRNLIPEYEYQDVLKVILSRAARSARQVPHYELDWPKEPVREPYYCHKHKRICYPVTEALKFLERYSYDVYRRIRAFQTIRKEVEVRVIHGDARTMRLEGQFDGILTSPPYVGLIDYHEQHRYAYELLGLEDLSRLEIGPLSEGQSERAKASYVRDMVEVFRNLLPYIRESGMIIFIVNDKFGLYDEIVSSARLRLEKRITRQVNRRTGRRSSEFGEDILIMRKGD